MGKVLSVIIPSYNEAASIITLLKRVQDTRLLNRLKKAGPKIPKKGENWQLEWRYCPIFPKTPQTVTVLRRLHSQVIVSSSVLLAHLQTVLLQ